AIVTRVRGGHDDGAAAVARQLITRGFEAQRRRHTGAHGRIANERRERLLIPGAERREEPRHDSVELAMPGVEDAPVLEDQPIATRRLVIRVLVLGLSLAARRPSRIAGLVPDADARALYGKIGDGDAFGKRLVALPHAGHAAAGGMSPQLEVHRSAAASGGSAAPAHQELSRAVAAVRPAMALRR